MLEYITQVLSPFKDAQKALEGEKYVNFSLILIVVHELRNILDGLIGANEPDTQPKLFDLVEMIWRTTKFGGGSNDVPT
jgi:hypothetical protein